MNKDRLRDSIRGALYGVAIGDALGGPLEFMNAEEIQKKYGKVTEMIGGGWLNLEPGETTDDTAMTLCVAEGILANPGHPFKAIGDNFIEWYKCGPKDIGGTCSQSIGYAIKNGGDWMAAAQETQDQMTYEAEGNGALMRTIYPALYYTSDHERREYTRTIARMTHAGTKSTAYCEEYVELIHGIILDEPFTMPRYETGRPPTGYVEDSYFIALESLGTTLSFKGALIKAVNKGGDADTIGAITGGLAGAAYGYNAIPEKWIDALDDKLKIQLDSLAEDAYVQY